VEAGQETAEVAVGQETAEVAVQAAAEVAVQAAALVDVALLGAVAGEVGAPGGASAEEALGSYGRR